MVTMDEMQKLIAEGQALYNQTMAECKRLTLLTYGDTSNAIRAMHEVAMQDVAYEDLPINDSELLSIFMEEAKYQSTSKPRAPLASRENDNLANDSVIDEFQSLSVREDERHPQKENVAGAEERHKKVDEQKFLQKYFKQNALRPVHVVEPGRLPYRHDQLLKMEQYRRCWENNPPPGERSWRSERWKIRQRMAEIEVPVLRLRRRSKSTEDPRRK